MSLFKPGEPKRCWRNLFNEWKPNTYQKVDSRIYHLSWKLDLKISTCALNETIMKQHLKDLYSKYVIAPIGKAACNVVSMSAV